MNNKKHAGFNEVQNATGMEGVEVWAGGPKSPVKPMSITLKQHTFQKPNIKQAGPSTNAVQR